MLVDINTALGDLGDQSAQDMQNDTDWVRAHDLEGFQGKQPQLFEGKIKPA